MSAGLVTALIADVLVILGVFIMTVGVYGMIRMPDTYTRLHAASKAVFLGVISLLAASIVTLDVAIILRVILIGFFILITTPVSAHVIGKAIYDRRERMQSPQPVDETERRLNRQG